MPHYRFKGQRYHFRYDKGRILWRIRSISETRRIIQRQFQQYHQLRKLLYIALWRHIHHDSRPAQSCGNGSWKRLRSIKKLFKEFPIKSNRPVTMRNISGCGSVHFYLMILLFSKDSHLISIYQTHFKYNISTWSIVHQTILFTLYIMYCAQHLTIRHHNDKQRLKYIISQRLSPILFTTSVIFSPQQKVAVIFCFFLPLYTQ